MELLYIPLFLTFILVLFKLKSFIHKIDSKLPPGPSQLPIIGSMHHLFGSLPHHRLRDLSKIHGEIMHLKLGEVSTIVISSPEAAKEIMTTQDLNFASRPCLAAMEIFSYGYKTMSFSPYSDYWRQLRKICILELLSANRVKSFEYIREEEVHNLIQTISNSANCNLTVNLSEMLKSLINNMVMRAAIGSMCKDQKTYLLAADEAIKLAAGFNLADFYPSCSTLLGFVTRSKAKVERCHQKIDGIIDGIIREHREKRAIRDHDSKGGEDLVDVLLRIQEDGGLQFQLVDDSIKAIIADIIGAGSETSSTVLEWAISELMRNSRVMRKVQSEVREALKGKLKITEADVRKMSYLQLVIKETFRLHAPVPLLLPRSCQKRCEVLGYVIPEKARVVVNVWAMGRDPQYWKDVEEFKPERFEGSQVDFKGGSFQFLPFGAGRRMCPGMSFGLANVEFPLAQLLYFFDWELPCNMRPSDLNMDDSIGVTAHRTSDLILSAISRIPCTLS